MAQSNVTKEEFLEKLLEETVGGNVIVACRSLHLAKSTVYYWKDNDNDFARKMNEIVKDAKDTLKQEAEYGLRKAVLSGNIAAIIFTLKHTAPNEWGDQKNLEKDELVRMYAPGVTAWLKKHNSPILDQN